MDRPTFAHAHPAIIRHTGFGQSFQLRDADRGNKRWKRAYWLLTNR